MFRKIYQATHPDMMESAGNDDLRGRYLLTDLFVPDEIRLSYSHNDRMIVGGAAPVTTEIHLPDSKGARSRRAVS